MKLEFERHKIINQNTVTRINLHKSPSVSKYFKFHTRLRMAWLDYRIKDGPEHCTENASRQEGTVRGNTRRPNHSHIIISVSVRFQMKC